MEFRVKIKPIKKTSQTKEGLINSIKKLKSNCVYTYFSNKTITIHGLSDNKNELFVFYNCHKVNKKVERIPMKKPIFNKFNYPIKHKSKVLNHKYWVAYVYVFRKEFIYNLPIKSIKQNNNNFVIEYHK